MPVGAPTAAKPTKHIFDPFNSSATGHQRADNRLSGSTSWRDSRSLKLREQYTAGSGGGKRVSDIVGAGSLDFGVDGRTENGGWVDGAKGLRSGGQQSLWETLKIDKDNDDRPSKRVKAVGEEVKTTSLVNPFTPFRKSDGTIRESSWTSHECSPSDLLEPIDPLGTPIAESSPLLAEESSQDTKDAGQPPQIFIGCRFYINGSTYPLSDHTIKHLIGTHGGNNSISLGRRTTTHVVIGKPKSTGGCGGGLAASKIQKEILSMRGRVKFVTAQWITESVKAGKRLPESRFEAMPLVAPGIGSISSMFKAK